MKIILVIITWLSHVPLGTVAIPQTSMEECEIWKAHYEQLFEQTTGLNYIVACKREQVNEYEA